MRAFAEMVAPVRCVGCGADGDELCECCADRVEVLSRPWCDRCGTPRSERRQTHESPQSCCSHLGGFDRARSLVAFAESSRGLTLQLKRRGRTPLAAAIGELLALLARREGLLTDAACVTWVPGGRATRRAGFDHAALMARAVARSAGIPAAPVLRRVVDGPRQADVSLAQRRTNVAGRFAATRAKTHVLLIDDVYTTGSTAEACATALKAAGAECVDVLTWARTRRLRPQ